VGRPHLETLNEPQTDANPPGRRYPGPTGLTATTNREGPMKQSHESPKEKEPTEHAERSAVIGEQILHALGQPGDLHKVQVRWLWNNRYRVNVFTGPDAVSAKVANSYFVVANDSGDIVCTNPKITNQYGTVAAGVN
jgi:hypothetical protein